MSEAGISIYNSNNILQIDSSYSCLCLKRKIKLSSLADKNTMLNYGVSLKLNNDELICGVGRSDSGKFNIYGLPLTINTVNDFWEDGTETTGTVYIWAWEMDNDDSIDDMYIYTFGYPTGDTHNTGMEVFDGNGKRVFDSEKRYMKILHYGATADFYSFPTNAILVTMGSWCWEDNGTYIDKFGAKYFFVGADRRVKIGEYSEDSGTTESSDDTLRRMFEIKQISYFVVDGNNM